MTAGMVRIPFRRYITINIVGQFIWTGFLIGVGYFFGHLYAEIHSIIGKVFIGILFVLFIFAFIRYKKFIENKTKQLDSI